MFDPTIGRWTTPDPKGFEAADADLFRYVRNNPTNFTDPSGLQGEVVYGDWKLKPEPFTTWDVGLDKWFQAQRLQLKMGRQEFTPSAMWGYDPQTWVYGRLRDLGPYTVRNVKFSKTKGDVTIRIAKAQAPRLWDATTKAYIPFPAPGILITVDTPNAQTAKEVQFVQFHKFVVRYWIDDWTQYWAETAGYHEWSSPRKVDTELRCS